MELQVRITYGTAWADSCSCLPIVAVCQAALVLDPFTVAMERLKHTEVSHLPAAMISHRNKYLFVNLKGKHNKIIMKFCGQWLLANMNYLTKLVYHPSLSAGCSSSLTNCLNKKREEIRHSCGTFPFKTFTFNTFHLNGLATQKWIKAALSQESHFRVQCNFSQIL